RCDSEVLVTPHPMTSESAFSSNSIAIFGSGNGESQGTVMRSGEYPATISAARRGATTIARSAPARNAASELKARQPAYRSLPPQPTTRQKSPLRALLDRVG